MSPEESLICAVLHQAVVDARSIQLYSRERRDALAFLGDREELALWCELVQLDADYMIPRLRREAGMVEYDG